jgi:hypothetical protein
MQQTFFERAKLLIGAVLVGLGIFILLSPQPGLKGLGSQAIQSILKGQQHNGDIASWPL